MNKFKEYQHVEKYGTEEVDGITLGEVYLFPKIDGSNAQIYLGDSDTCVTPLQFGSRHRDLTLDYDNLGFMTTIVNSSLLDNFKRFFIAYSNYRLFGEWLKPHTLKTYRSDAWNKFYVFDVEVDGVLIPYNDYQPLLEAFGIEYIPPLCIMMNPTDEQLMYQLNKNTYLIEDDKGIGEGVVLKNYNFRNKYGRQTWAKIVTSDFKDKNLRTMGAPKIQGASMVESEIINKYVTQALVDKVYAKIVAEREGWNSKYIPQLLNTVYYDLIREETWEFLKEYKQPTIDFKLMTKICNNRVKELKKEVF